MKFSELDISGVWMIEPDVYQDKRGYFMESFKQQLFETHIGPVQFIQENESKSVFGVLRGMHAQSGEAAQAKLVRTITGKVLDVAVDMRRGSSTFGKYVAVELSEENKRQLFVPRGFYHGFLVLSPEAIFSYKVDNLYNPAAEVSLHYADPSVGIHWPLPKTDLLLSPKDEAAPAFSAAYTF